ncbi:ribosome recycling factor [Coraliomargarita akajimensis]|uniref:Ribosome-recycling factor n=1 Tax=Coraliomargarita akajimensis (strain DSM 45221 / IAM 15411 / JCM 23193 / KCTC 12865 / 04OKA010-24) TaxID=583355 RepID=D5EQQ4_CORAD|nr:ribosome recycling factor [Coraliomargarita akajimensis]ADE55868.1 ribosome recycling factor [Coraliomargarita akajimensis DSM 45221]
MEPNEIMSSVTADMKKAVEHTLGQFGSLHTGKASPAMLDSVKVDAYGSTVTLKEVAAVTTPDARTIVVQPWDKSVIREVEKGIIDANLGFNPLVDGGILRVPVPELTGERRAELAKQAGGMAEDGRVRIRSVRRDGLDLLKSAKDDGLSEDDVKRYEKEIQTEHDKYIAEINDQLSKKEADLKKV